ncbi:ThuA domain-containing protein [Planctomicrobium piriforme]|uniref:Trehalose utilisation n=1 Tax=Planctomicrobium piriforme TaxID=1576369 RepID=A0A1I3MX40_9PLAN|nr:ThuA domain-containing protein [Planctomicrobium piriforme]SFJ01350.1 Trehalose utilisation [Planctomicrobium piriforme]
MRCSVLAVCFLLYGVSLPAAEPIRALMITGGCCHDYEHQKQIISEGVSQRANVTWTILHAGGDKRDFEVPEYRNKDWAKGYDVIVHNECFGAVTDPEFVKAITAEHFKGVPAVIIHCSLHSYRTSGAADAWRELIGVTSKSHEKARPEHVVRLDLEHPVMAGFPKVWDTPNGELYKIEKVWPNCTPLAIAVGVESENQNPVIWVNKFGEAKVFGTSLGHHNETMNTPEWLDLVARGTLWTVGKLGEDGKPLPGYEGTGAKPIILQPLKPIPEPASNTK